MAVMVNEKGQLVGIGSGLSDHDRTLYGLGSVSKQADQITQASVQQFDDQALEELAYNKTAQQKALDDIEQQAGGTGDQIQFLNLQED
jgi:hypothetical protein